MKEAVITLTGLDPLGLFGVNDSYVDLLRQKNPDLKIIARGEEIKIQGKEEDVNEFSRKLTMLIDYYRISGVINEDTIADIFSGSDIAPEKKSGSNDVLVFGQNGLLVKARTPNQQRMVEGIGKNDIVFAIGPAGTGKTYTAVALAVRALKNREVKRIVLTRPAVEAGENLGFLPGDLKEKIDPYLRPLYDALYDMLPGEKVKTYLETGVIEIAPLAFMRGRTLNHAFVILDEAQNATENQLKMFLTRMGPSAKFIVTGDITQVDLPRQQPSGLLQAMKILSDIKGIEFIFLEGKDVIRHRLVRDIIGAYDVAKENPK